MHQTLCEWYENPREIHSVKMNIDILICTLDEGIQKVPYVLMPEQYGVRYVVSMQWTEESKLGLVPECLKTRDDVTMTYLEGRGLSRNRNNAISHAQGDVLVIADDDNRYTPQFVETIRLAYSSHPDVDIITFQGLDYDGHPIHEYPAMYVCSCEMTFRKHVTTQFDVRFGLGSRMFCAGEEQVWMKDAECAGWKAVYVPKPIVMTSADTTGIHFLGNAQLQRSKGATFRYVYGTADAVWRSIKEAGWYLVHRRANPFPILLNMMKGIASL